MPRTFSKLTFCILASLSLALVAGITLLSPGLPRVSSSTQSGKQQAALKMAGDSTPLIKLQEGRELDANFTEARTLRVSSAMRESGVKPLALASGDLNRDGYPDLVCGYASSAGGILTLYRGDPHAFAPEDPEVLKGIAAGQFPDTFLKDATVYDLPEAPDFLSTGDFNRDGKVDIVVAGRGGHTLYLLEGQEDGGFSQPVWIPLTGSVTAMITGGFNNRDGLSDVILGVDSPGGASLLVYDGLRSILETEPNTYRLPAKASSLALGSLDDDPFEDIAVLANGEVFILHGRDNSAADDSVAAKKAGKLETVQLPFTVKAMALGEFIWDREARTEIATLDLNDAVHIVTRGELDTRPWTADEILESRRQMAKVREKLERRKKGEQVTAPAASSSTESSNWQVAEDLQGPDAATAATIASDGGSVQPILLSTRISALPSDDLLVMNPAKRQLQVVYKQGPKQGDAQLAAATSADRSAVSLEEDDVTAVLPMRVNVDGRPGLVVMSRGKSAPVVFMPLAAMIFTVTKNADTNDGACNADCSLREAIIASNANPGADTIAFNPGVNPVLTITGSDNAAALGDLDINDAVTITGNNQTIINTTYGAGCGDCKVFGVNQDGTHSGIAVSFSGVTVQNGFNDHIATGTFQETGGGIDFFLTGTGHVYSMSNCVVTSNEVKGNVQSYGGGINIDSGSPSPVTNHGTVTLTNTTISNNTSDATGGGISARADIHNVTITTCTITGNTTLSTALGLGAQGGGIDIRHTNGGTVLIQTNSTISNNTAKGQGGGLNINSGNTTTSFTISDTAVSGNTSQNSGASPGNTASAGGGLFLSNPATLTNVNITTNHSNLSGAGNSEGGGVFAAGGTSTMTGGSISSNTSNGIGGTGGRGGGLVAAGGSFTMTNVTVSSNNATGDGGAIFTSSTGAATLNITGGSISSNTSANGAALATASNSVVVTTITNTPISNNIASTDTGGVLTRFGTVNLDGITFTGNTAPSVKTTGGTTTTANTVSISNDVTTAGGTLSAGSSSVSVGGNFTFSSGTFTSGTSTFTFNGTGAQAINGPSSPTFNNLTVNKASGTLTLAVNISLANASAAQANLAVNAGTFDLSNFTANRTTSGGTLTVSNGATLKIGGTNTLPSNYATHSIGATSNIDYSGTSQNVSTLNSSQKYGNLLTSGSGTKTLAGAISIATSLTIGSGTTLDVSASNFAISFTGANWTNNGTFNPRSGTVTFDPTSGTQLLSGNTTFFNLTLQNTGATTDLGSGTTTINNTLSKTAGSMNGGTGTIIFTGVAGSIIGAGAKEFNNLTINSGAVISHTAGNISIKNDYANNGTFTQGPALTTTFITGADGSHSLSGSGATTFGNVAINTANTVDAGSHNFSVVGTSFDVTGTFTGNTSTVTFNGAVAQAITGNGTKNFSGLTINNSSGVTVSNIVANPVDASVSGLLTLTTDLTIAASAILQQSGTSGGGADALGTVRRTDLGVAAKAFGNPNVTIAIDSGTPPNPMDVNLVKTAPPDFTTSVTRTYSLTPTGGAGISATVKLHYLTGELNGNTETKLGLWKKVGAIWVVQGRTSPVDTINKSVTLSGVTSFSDWTLADMPDVSVTVTPTSSLEDTGPNMVYTFTRTGSTTAPLTVNFAVGGTATPPGGPTPDYSQTGAATFTTTTGSVTIGAGSASANVNIDPTADTTVETDETVILTVSAATNYNVGAPPSATGTITNDDTDVSIAVSPSSVTENGAPNLTYTFTRTGVTTGTLVVNFSVAGSSASAADDYTVVADPNVTFVPGTGLGTVTFTGTNTTATVVVDPTGDNTVETDETVVMSVQPGTGYNVAALNNSATGTITNDDATVSVAVAPSSVLEDGATNLTYTFTRTGFTGAALTVNFAATGTASATSDYTVVADPNVTFVPGTGLGTVTFTGANTTATVVVDPTTDVTAENNETVIISIATGTNYTATVPTSATGTITDDDTTVSVAVSPASVLENSGSPLTYTFTRTGDTSTNLVVNFSIGGSATFTTDYTQSGATTFTPPTGTVTIVTGNTTAQVIVTPVGDTAAEPNEDVILTVTSGTGYGVGSPSVATGTITNDDTEVSVAVAPSSVTENGATNLTYTFTRTGVTTGTLVVNFNVTGSTASAASDYTVITGPDVTFNSGLGTGTVQFTGSSTTATVTVDPTGDDTVETDETVIVNVAAGSGYTVGTPSNATGTISNDDADVSVAVSTTAGPGTSVLEDGATNLVYTFTRTGFTGAALTVNFTIGGSATFPTDYGQTGAASFVPPNGTVTFTGTNTTATVTIDPVPDATGEADETVILTVTSGTNYTPAAPTSATGTITNDDTAVSVAVSPTSSAEDTGPNMVYTFTRTGDTSTALLVNFSVGGTATPPGGGTPDYSQTGADTFTTTTGTITIPIGNASAAVTVDPTTDTTVETDETVILTVTAGSGYAPGAPNPATGTILNDDTDVSVTVSPLSVAENSGTSLVYTFTRTGVTTGTLTANFTIGGSATFTTDYTQSGAASFVPPNGSVNFALNSPTATVTITPVGDTSVETDETVILSVAAGTGYNIAASNNSATGTITNDDAAVSVAVSPLSVAEDGATNLTYTFTRTGFTGGPLTVNFAATGTASATSDYTVVADPNVTFVPGTGLGTVTFTGSNTTATVVVDPTVDVSGESNETVIVSITAGANYTATAPTSATGTILDDDTSVSVVVSPTSVAENSGSSMTYTFTRTGDTTGALVVSFSIGGSATFTTDYTQSGATSFTPPTGTVTIGAGNATADVIVTPVGDSTVETNEDVVLTVTAGSGYGVGAPSVATGTITNDDTDVSVTVSPLSVAENSGTSLVYTFTRTGVTTGTLTANFTIGGSATFTTDYTQSGAASFVPPNGSVNFALNSPTATVTITPVGDTDVETDETVILTVAAGTGYNVAASNNSATGTITNDDSTVSVAVSPLSVAEDGATNLTYTFTRSGFTGGPQTVNFAATGTASATSDYTVVADPNVTFVPGTGLGTVTFTGSNTTATVVVDPTADGSAESNETVVISITAGANYTATAPTSATGTILDDDTSVSVVVSPTSVAENSGSSMTYTFTRTGDTTNALLVNFSIGGSATFTTDYTQSGATSFTPPTGTVTIGAGNTMANVIVTPVGDSTVEPNEDVVLTVTAGTGYGVGAPSVATGTILNDDTDVSVAVSPTMVAENSGTGMVYTFTRTGVTAGALTVNFSIGGSATFMTDYVESGAATFTPPTGMVTFGAGNSTATVTVTPVADSDVEGNETVILTVTSGTGYNVGTPDTATGTITNDDTDVTLSVSPSSVGEDGATPLVYTFTRSGVTMGALTVNFTIGGTATFTNDYTQSGAATFDGSTGSVVIADGNSMATVTVTPVNDVKVEGSETVSLTLSASPNYDVGTPGAVTGTIVDNDTATVAFASSSSNAPEQTTPHNVGVTLVITANGTGTPMLERTVSVNVQNLLTGTATNGGTDYTYSPNPKTVTFNSGDIAQTKNVSITIVDDSFSEGTETINLALNTLVDGTGGQVSIVSPTAHTVNIVDNDIDLQVTKTESADPVAAGSGPSNLTYVVKVKNIGLTAATGVVLSETLTLPPGVTLVSITGSAGTTVTPVVPNVSYTWTVGGLAVNAEATLTVVLTVGAGTSAGTNVICDTATVTASGENRVNTSDDTKTECTSVVAQADVEIVSKTDAPDPVCVGGDITYTISYKNNGPGPGLNAKVTDPVPANTTLVSATTASPGWGRTDAVPAGGTGNIVFAKASVANGETAMFQIVVKVNAGTVHGTTITNTATASSDLTDPTPGNNSKTATTTVDPNPPTFPSGCPAAVNVAAAATCPFSSTATVTYANPPVSDDCPGATVACVPPSGAMFPVGTTTVTCTATDSAGNTATCTFPVTVFNLCLQDDTVAGNVVLVNTTTGEWRFCCNGVMVASGVGTKTGKGCVAQIQQVAGNLNVLIKIDTGVRKGTANIQVGSTQCSITDRDMTNNTCICP